MGGFDDSNDKKHSSTGVWATPIFFLHVPKTAGTAVRHFLEAALHPHEVYRVSSVNEEVRVRSVERLPGHVKFASAHLPLWYRDAFQSRASTLMLLRHPVERALSTYRFWRSAPAPDEADQSAEACLLRTVKRATIEEFANNADGIWWGAISNYAAWLLGHPIPWDLTAPVDELTPRLARKRLPSLEMLGTTERIQESMSLIAEYIGVPLTRPLPALNATPIDREAKAAPDSVVDALMRANDHDLALWENANAEIDRRLRCRPRNNTVPLTAALTRKRFNPSVRNGHYEIRPGEDPLLCEGWLPPESAGNMSWRFTVLPGPASICLQWPPCDGAFALVIESPFAAKGFDYRQIEISLDGEQIACRTLELPERTVIITQPIETGRLPARTLAFSYRSPADKYWAAQDRKSHEGQIAFAVRSIRWLPCAQGAWSVAAEAAAFAHEAGLVASRRASEISTLEGMIAIKDEYILSLSQALSEQAKSPESLRAALDRSRAEGTLAAA